MTDLRSFTPLEALMRWLIAGLSFFFQFSAVSYADDLEATIQGVTLQLIRTPIQELEAASRFLVNASKDFSLNDDLEKTYLQFRVVKKFEDLVIKQASMADAAWVANQPLLKDPELEKAEREKLLAGCRTASTAHRTAYRQDSFALSAKHMKKYLSFLLSLWSSYAFVVLDNYFCVSHSVCRLGRRSRQSSFQNGD